MPVEIDGFAVLAAVGRTPNAFPAVSADVVKVAKTLVGKQLKEKSLTLQQLRSVVAAISADAFELIADGMSDAEVKSLLSKIDKYNPEIKSGGAEQRRSMVQLAGGLAEPTKKPGTPAKPPSRKDTKPKVERSGNSRAMSARRKTS